MMNGNGQQYAFRSPRSIGKQPNSQKEIIGKMDLTPKKKINFDLSKPIQLKGQNSQRPLQQMIPQSQKTISNVNQQQPLNSMQRQYQGLVKNYEQKLKNMKEEHEKAKSEMQKKIIFLQKQKNQLKGVINKLNEDGVEKNRRLSFEPMYEKNKLQDNKNWELYNKVKQENNSLLIEKDKIFASLNKMKFENQKLQNQIKGLNREITKLHQTQFPQRERSISPKPNSRPHSHSHHKHSHSHHHNHSHHINPPQNNKNQQQQQPLNANQTKEIQKLKGQCQTFKILISQINEEKVKKDLQQLNQKYAKQAQTHQSHQSHIVFRRN